MNEQDILNFKQSISNLSIEELNDKRVALQEKISQMIMESDVIMKVAIVESLLKEKIEKEQNNGKIVNGKN